MDAADHCIDHLGNTDGTRNDQLYGLLAQHLKNLTMGP